MHLSLKHISKAELPSFLYTVRVRGKQHQGQTNNLDGGAHLPGSHFLSSHLIIGKQVLGNESHLLMAHSPGFPDSSWTLWRRGFPTGHIRGLKA